MSITGSDGWQPIHLATASGHTKAVELLLLAGAEVDRRLPPSENPWDPRGGTTPLRTAVLNHHYEIVDLLLAAQADLSILLEPCSGGSTGHGTSTVHSVEEGEDFFEATRALAQADPAAGRGFDPERLEALRARAVAGASPDGPASDDGAQTSSEPEPPDQREEEPPTRSGGTEDSPPGELPSGLPAEFSAFAARVGAVGQATVDVRTMLSWFGALRRGSRVMEQIESACRQAGITSRGAFDHAGMEESVVFYGSDAEAGPLADPVDSSEESVPAQATPEKQLPGGGLTPSAAEVHVAAFRVS